MTLSLGLEVEEVAAALAHVGEATAATAHRRSPRPERAS
jgi:hypothetical protein